MQKYAALSIALLCSVAVVKAETVRVINTVEVMQQSKQGQEVIKGFNDEQVKISRQLEAEQQQLVQARNNFESKKAAMAPEAMRKEQRDLEVQETAFKGKITDAESTLREAMQSRTEVVAQSVEKTIKEVAKEAKADIVLDEMTGRVVYASDSLKVTKNAIEKMNQEFEHTAAATKTTTDAVKTADATTTATAKKDLKKATA